MHESDRQTQERAARLRERYGALLREPRERSMLRWARLLRWRRAGSR